MSSSLDPTVAAADALLSSLNSYRILREYIPQDFFAEALSPTRIGVLIDTETTGPDVQVDQLVELGLIKFEYEVETGKVCRVLERFSGFNEPTIPISPEASAVNGITFDMVKDHRISAMDIEEFLGGVSFIAAHNARFDRVIAEKLFPSLVGMEWACTLTQIPWQEMGALTRKQEVLCMEQGFFYHAHRAVVDCEALLYLLSKPCFNSLHTGLFHLLSEYSKRTLTLQALDTAFATKEVLKSRGYRWNEGSPSNPKGWFCEISEGDKEAELTWLRDTVYRGKPFQTLQSLIGADTRFGLSLPQPNLHSHGVKDDF